jgi:hypothetical protein
MKKLEKQEAKLKVRATFGPLPRSSALMGPFYCRPKLRNELEEIFMRARSFSMLTKSR